jgi:hypothetical protein
MQRAVEFAGYGGSHLPRKQRANNKNVSGAVSKANSQVQPSQENPKRPTTVTKACMHMRPKAGAPALSSRHRLQSTISTRERVSAMNRFARLAVSQQHLDCLQDSKSTVRRAVQELPLASNRPCGANTNLPKISTARGC